MYSKRENITEFWEEAFKDKQEMWGLKPAPSAVVAKDFFVENKVTTVLIPGNWLRMKWADFLRQWNESNRH